jgi:hypothetical protein
LYQRLFVKFGVWHKRRYDETLWTAMIFNMAVTWRA